jgi:hypothetical protein
VLVVLGVDDQGRKELLAMERGYRESADLAEPADTATQRGRKKRAKTLSAIRKWRNGREQSCR